MNDWEETLQWYRDNTNTSDIGFNPDGMCLKVCRTARGIPSMYPDAKTAQNNTPAKHRVTNVRDLRKGMVLYFDDPNDSNKYGHIVTMIGRVPGFDEDSLDDILTVTNSYKSGELVVMRASFYENGWGDKFQFGAAWLNGVAFDVYAPRTRVQKFRRSGPDYNVRELDRAIADDGRVDLRRYRDQLDSIVKELSTDKRRVRVQKFLEFYNKNRILRMDILNEVVNESPKDVTTRMVRNALRRLIKSLPEK